VGQPDTVGHQRIEVDCDRVVGRHDVANAGNAKLLHSVCQRDAPRIDNRINVSAQVQ
jgi:hypothetical protein